MGDSGQLQLDLIKKCKQCDPKSQLQLYEQYCHAMYRTAYNFVRQEAAAEDLMQEAFIKAFQKLDHFDGKASFGSWLKKIVINHCLDWLKKRKLRVVSMDHSHVEIADESNWEVHETVSIEQILNAIEQLPEKYKIPLKLFLLEGYDHSEIAGILNITEINSRSQVHRGKNKLKELLKQYQYA
ncbi:MAG: RNA polymerase sigma factor [Flavobacteriaceae bacterium]|nr:RNA polymerase sigma factor [Flavobacteriaceae bacterium]